MKMDKVLSFYNLQDEKELEKLMDEMEDLEYEKISTEGCDGAEATVYRLSIGECVNVVGLMNIFTFMMKKNDNSRFKISKVKKFIVY